MKNSLLSQPVFICGMMGAGKSTIGKKLARYLDLPFSDLDDLIEQSENMSIPEIFKKKGENAFREIEQKILIKKSQSVKGIMALGGGSLQNQQITDHVKLYGWLLFLDAPLKTLVNRLKSSNNRPMIADTDLETKLNKLLSERNKYYRQAHISINTGKLTADETVQEIVKKITFYENSR